MNEAILEQVIQFFNDYILKDLGTLATMIGVMIAAFTFWKTFGKMKKSEQYKMSHDIQVMYSNAQINYNKTVLSISDFPDDEVRERVIQQEAFKEVLNVLEWASFLIWRNELDKDLQDYFKPLIKTWYKNCKDWYPSLLNHEHEYREIKRTIEKWNWHGT